MDSLDSGDTAEAAAVAVEVLPTVIEVAAAPSRTGKARVTAADTPVTIRGDLAKTDTKTDNTTVIKTDIKTAATRVAEGTTAKVTTETVTREIFTSKTKTAAAIDTTTTKATRAGSRAAAEGREEARVGPPGRARRSTRANRRKWNSSRGSLWVCRMPCGIATLQVYYYDGQIHSWKVDFTGNNALWLTNERLW